MWFILLRYTGEDFIHVYLHYMNKSIGPLMHYTHRKLHEARGAQYLFCFCTPSLGGLAVCAVCHFVAESLWFLNAEVVELFRMTHSFTYACKGSADCMAMCMISFTLVSVGPNTWIQRLRGVAQFVGQTFLQWRHHFNKNKYYKCHNINVWLKVEMGSNEV